MLGGTPQKRLKMLSELEKLPEQSLRIRLGWVINQLKLRLSSINGESVPEFIDTGAYWYDASNMDEDHIAPLLYD